MNQLLKPKQRVHTEFSDLPCEVEQFLGGGGQGEVYRAHLGNTHVALKWYYPPSATPEQHRGLELLIKQGPPSDRFLWPMELATAQSVPGFGYIMPLREARYKSLVDLMNRQIEPTFRALVTAGLGLAHSFLKLHAQGLCYCDISFGNAFFDPTTGDILICDNDNVIVNGEVPPVIGSQRFMAPEVVRGETSPNTQTDLFSLAVLLFYMFILHHPLEGKRETAISCLDAPAMTRLYGTDPLFIFDPADRSNAPDPDYHKNALAFWPIYPQFLRDLFTKAFTDGLRDPQHGRVREGEWRLALARLRDAILYCQHCGAENFYDVDALRASSGTLAPCWGCQGAIQLPMRIRIGRHIVMLNHDTQLFPHHIDEDRLYDLTQPLATVTQHPTDPRIWGLRNLSPDKWVTTLADGTTREVEPDRSVTMALGTKIHFGKAEGEIRL